MNRAEASRQLEVIARDLDLAVFSLERPAPDDPRRATRERQRLRRELEAVRDQLQELARALG